MSITDESSLQGFVFLTPCPMLHALCSMLYALCFESRTRADQVAIPKRVIDPCH